MAVPALLINMFLLCVLGNMISESVGQAMVSPREQHY